MRKRLAGLIPGLFVAGLLCAQNITISGPELAITFSNSNHRLRLEQIRKRADPPLLYRDRQLSKAGSGAIGNPFAVVIRQGAFQGVYMPDSFHVLALRNTDRSLLAYLAHDSLPAALVLSVEMEGSVATWRGQVLWNGSQPVELDVYLPLLSRVKFASPEKDRLLASEVSGMVLNSLGTLNFSDAYIGSMSAPVLLAEGGGRGLAILDDNRAEYAADPSACALRGLLAGNRFPLSDMPWTDAPLQAGGESGPLLGVRYTRRFRPIADFGGEAEWERAEKIRDPLPVRKLGEAIDIGPVKMYAYAGSWKQGADWIRQERSDLPFRASQPEWYRRTSFVSEAMGDDMVKAGMSFYDYPKILAEKQSLGSDLFTIPGFSEPEILGSSSNFLNRGDYFFAADNLGGFAAQRAGIDALHRQGGHILYYVEGLIVWKRSRVGRAYGKEWAVMNEDGTYSETYKGFYDMCPAVRGWQDWFADTAAEIVRTSGVDGFFIDSLTATNYHRCFNPLHHHPHPDVWTWGVRQFLRRVREGVDRANPGAILFTEGEADIAREFTDGFITHSAFWNHGTFTEPLTRFIYPQMRAFESWGYAKDPQAAHVFNSVNGQRIYAHNSSTGLMTPLSRVTRRYYDAFPEIVDGRMSGLEIRCEGCLAALFDGTRPVLTVGNATPAARDTEVSLPVPAAILFDRVTGERVPLENGRARLRLAAWQFRAFELRP